MRAIIRSLLPRSALLIAAHILIGLLQWGFIKLVAIAQPSAEFGRFVTVTILGLIVTAPLVTLQGGISRQVAFLIATGREDAVPGYVRGLLRMWLAPVGGLAAILLLAAPLLAGGLELEEAASVRLVVGLVVVFLPFHLVLGTLAGRGRVVAFSALMLAEGALRCAGALVAPGLIHSTPGALTVALVALLAATAMGVWVLRADLLRPAAAPVRPGRLPALLPGFLIGAVLLSAVAFQDALLVRLVLGAGEASRYAAAIAIGRMLQMLPYPMLPVLVPAVARLAGMGRSPRGALFLHLFLVLGPCVAAVIAGLLRPDLFGRIILDPGKYADLGILVPLALGASAGHALTNLSLHYLMALGRQRVLLVLAVALVVGPVLVLTAPAQTSAILGRMVALSGALFLVVFGLALRPAGTVTP